MEEHFEAEKNEGHIRHEKRGLRNLNRTSFFLVFRGVPNDDFTAKRRNVHLALFTLKSIVSQR